MTSDVALIVGEIVEKGGLRGSVGMRVLDLGGGTGVLRDPLQCLGYRYFNVDIQQFHNGEPSVVADAHALPFLDGTFHLAVSKDSLEHFLRPWIALQEVHRVLIAGGLLALWVPFMHPFHGNDLYRYSPLGLQHLLTGFEILSIRSPRWIFTILALPVVGLLKRVGMGFLERPIKRLAAWMDDMTLRGRRRPTGFAAVYLVMARKSGS